MKKANLHILLIILFFEFSFVSFASAQNEARVLLYHDVSRDITDTNIATAMPFEKFVEQMYYLYDSGYKAITVSELFEGIKNGTLPEKVVAITFDDGYLHIYNEVFPFLKELGFTATTYLVGEKINLPKNLSGEMIREMYEAGWEIGSHSMSHSDLLTSDNLDYEICYSKKHIANITKIPLEEISSFAYPYGNADEKIMTKVYKCGFKNGAGLGNMLINSNSNPYYFARYSMYASVNLPK